MLQFLQEVGAATAAAEQSAPSTEDIVKQKLEPYQERMKVSQTSNEMSAGSLYGSFSLSFLSCRNIKLPLCVYMYKLSSSVQLLLQVLEPATLQTAPSALEEEEQPQAKPTGDQCKLHCQ